jgi:hypothetical protein
MKNKILKVVLALVFVAAISFGLSSAADEKNVSVPGGSVINGDYINAGQTVDVGSDATGDVILAGANVSYSGNAGGDILLAGGDVRVKGNSGGNVRIAGGNITIDGTVEKNVTIMGGSVLIEETSVIKGNLYVAGGNVEIRGTVNGNASVYSSQTQFSGKVLGNADFRSNEVIIRPDANIGGNLTYASNTDIGSTDNIVKGTITKVQMQNYANNNKISNSTKNEINIGVIVWQLLSLLVVGYVLFKLFRKQSQQLVGPVTKEEIWNRIAYGLLALILNLLVIFVIFITIVGLPLALMILFVYIILFIAAAVLSPVIVGRLVNSKLKLYAYDEKHLAVDFIIGYVVMEIIKLIPILGPLALAFLFLFSYGRITNFIMNMIKQNKIEEKAPAA